MTTEPFNTKALTKTVEMIIPFNGRKSIMRTASVMALVTKAYTKQYL